MGSDTRSPRSANGSADFNPRSRMGSDGVIGLKLTLHERFQSTLPHGERPPLYLRPLQAQAISIHAPAWGATNPLTYDANPQQISIHAPAWGATARRCRDTHRLCDFNPRSRMGSDAGGRAAGEHLADISIHAPAWGATMCSTAFSITGIFQSTLPHGERRRSPARSGPSGTYFNPRSRMGSDKQSRDFISSSDVFQSTLPHGERHDRPHFGHPHLVISIHAPAWGATGAACPSNR